MSGYSSSKYQSRAKYRPMGEAGVELAVIRVGDEPVGAAANRVDCGLRISDCGLKREPWRGHRPPRLSPQWMRHRGVAAPAAVGVLRVQEPLSRTFAHGVERFRIESAIRNPQSAISQVRQCPACAVHRILLVRRELIAEPQGHPEPSAR